MSTDRKSSTDGPIALVTGGSRGIGRAIALQLADDGFTVVVNYQSNAEAADDVRRAITSKGGCCVVRGFDVSVREEVETAIKELTRELGTIDVLVNNAAILRDRPLASMQSAHWDDSIATNLTGVFHCTRAVVRTWSRKRHGSRIVNISSVAGEAGNAYQSNYSATKAGMIGFTKALARELAPRNITVNAVAPGLIATDGSSHLSFDDFLPGIPLGRVGQPEDVAHLVSFLVSDKAGYITGQVVRVDGGVRM